MNRGQLWCEGFLPKSSVPSQKCKHVDDIPVIIDDGSGSDDNFFLKSFG